jgi:hypothetical protein
VKCFTQKGRTGHTIACGRIVRKHDRQAARPPPSAARCRHLYGDAREDPLGVGQVAPSNPASAVRGPKHVIKRGKTPVLTTDQARVLIESIDTSTLVGLRDRALIGVMNYAFARIDGAKARDLQLKHEGTQMNFDRQTIQ